MAHFTCKNNNDKLTLSLVKFYDHPDFKILFNIFKLKKNSILRKMLLNWDYSLEISILNKLLVDCEDYEEGIKLLSINEIKKIILIGKYAISELKLNPRIALIFSLAIFYGICIFEETEVFLTLREIYNIIPKKERSEKEFKNFKKIYFSNGTCKYITNILYSQ